MDRIAPSQVTVGPFSPRIFASNGRAIAVNPHGTLAWPAGLFPGLTTHPAKVGDAIIVYTTGIGAVDNAVADGQNSLDKLRNTPTKPVVQIGGLSANVLFSGLSPQFVGVNQFNIVVPDTPGDAVAIQLQVGGITTPTGLTIAVTRALPGAFSIEYRDNRAGCDFRIEPPAAWSSQYPHRLSPVMAYSILKTRQQSFNKISYPWEMQASPDGGVTQFLGAFHNGDPESEARLMELTYRELRKIAAGHIRRERSVRSLQATDLVNEAYLRLVDQTAPLRDRAHFFQVAAHVMRQILIDRARKRRSGKRGGGAPQIDLDKALNIAEAHSGDLLVLDQALARLQSVDARQCQVVTMRFFGGMTEERIAESLGISTRTVNREWRMARAWLYKEIQR